MPTTLYYSMSKAAAELAAALSRSRVHTRHAERLAPHHRIHIAVASWRPLDALVLPYALQKALDRPVLLAEPLLPTRGTAAPILQALFTGGDALPVGSASPLDAPRIAMYDTAVRGAIARSGNDGASAVVVPAALTYHGAAARQNLFARIAARTASGAPFAARAVDDALLAGTVLDPAAAVSVCLGRPLLIDESRETARAAGCTAPGEFEAWLAGRVREEATRLHLLDYRHMLALVLAEMPARGFTPWQLRVMAYRLARRLVRTGDAHLHEDVRDGYGELIYGDVPLPVDEMIATACDEGLVVRGAGGALRRRPIAQGYRAPSSILARRDEAAVQPGVRWSAQLIAYSPHWWSARRVRAGLLRDDIECFEADYARNFHEELSKGPDVGRPFLLRPWRVKGAVVLGHGYMSAPLEIRALANHLCSRGYAVYGTRFRGHGTSPEDLARTPWTAWYEGYNRGYGIVRTISPNVFLAGFSTGGCIALLAAARKGNRVRGVVPICAPLRLVSTSVRLVPSVVALNALLKRFAWTGWEYLANVPENKHINYTQNPLTGMRELIELMALVERLLPQVTAPVFGLWATKDPTVDKTSAQVVCDKAGAAYREVALFESDRHGIVNGPGSEAVHKRVSGFLDNVLAGSTISFQRIAQAIEATAPAEAVAPQDLAAAPEATPASPAERPAV